MLIFDEIQDCPDARTSLKFFKEDGRAEDYVGSLQWLEDAGMIHRCYNTEATGLPMEGNAIESVFKVYVTDIGL